MSAAPVVGVVGAGAMGSGIAELAARQGCTVRLHDSRAETLEHAVSAIGARLGRDVDKGRLEAAEADAARARLAPASLAEVAVADIVIEAIVEDLAAKQALLRTIEAVARPDAILATNTSSLSVSGIAEVLDRPGRFAGLHFFNPPTRMRVVEIVRGVATTDATLAALAAFAVTLGQHALHVGDTPGFLVNRLGRGYTGEALRILDEGAATPEAIDAIARGALGFRMGPFELLDLTGLDVSAEVTRQVWKGFDEEPRFRPAPIVERRVAAGLLGRKTGRGFYRYGPDGKVVLEPPWPADAEPVPVRLIGIPADLAGGAAAMFPPALLTKDPSAVPVVGPVGTDVATEARRLGLDPARTVGIDPVFTGVATVAGSDLGLTGGVAASIRATGRDAVVVGAGAGQPAQRIAVLVVLIACDVASGGIAAPSDIDAATRLALSYPRGPLALGDAVGAARIAAMARGFHALTGDPRWRPSAWLDARVAAGETLADSSTPGVSAPN